MTKYHKIEFLDKYIVTNVENGDTQLVNREINETEYSKLFEATSDFSVDLEGYKCTYICIQSSNSCNLNCKYCFLKDKGNYRNLTLSETKGFIDYIAKLRPTSEKIFVDLSGAGEPLLRLDYILSVAEYCHTKSDELCKEFLPTLVTNGMGLSVDIANKLSSAGVLYGISVDGTKKNHDENRLDKEGKKTYSRIITNAKKIPSKDFVGVAVTICDAKMSLVKALNELSKVFPTISMKPVRSNVAFNTNEIKVEYTKLARYLMNRIEKNDLYELKCLLNGDDYFGKFLCRVFANDRILTRCDAGMGRFFLATDRMIYACPASVGINELKVGSLEFGVDETKRKEIFSGLTERKKCSNCEAKYICGGECMVQAYYNHGNLFTPNEELCDIKRHLYSLGQKMKYIVLNSYPKVYEVIYNFIKEKKNRYLVDEDLRDTLEKIGFSKTFTELKKMKDFNYSSYKNLRELLDANR